MFEKPTERSVEVDLEARHKGEEDLKETDADLEDLRKQLAEAQEWVAQSVAHVDLLKERIRATTGTERERFEQELKAKEVEQKQYMNVIGQLEGVIRDYGHVRDSVEERIDGASESLKKHLN